MRTIAFCDRDDVAAILMEQLVEMPSVLSKPIFVFTVGLPGAGKTYLTQRLVMRLPAIVLESDRLRNMLFLRPSYSSEESALLFDICHRLIEEFLLKKLPVVLDATNLLEANRRKLYDISDKTGASLFIVRVSAPRKLIRERLKSRALYGTRGYSRADWNVYKRMAIREERVEKKHYEVDTSRDIEGFVESLFSDINRCLGSKEQN